nr:30S ribosomal protein S4 [Poropsis sp. ID1_4]
MSRYRGPKIRILKRLGSLPGFGLKINQKFKKRRPISNTSKNKNKNKKSSFSIRLKEKQKLRYNYGLTEKNLVQYVREAKVRAKKKKISTVKTLLTGLEKRLDNIIFKLGFAPTIPSARQLITHGHICLNGKKITIPSFQCSKNDLVTWKKPHKINAKKFQQLFLSRKNKSLKARRNALLEKSLDINELLVIEYYSRNL